MFSSAQMLKCSKNTSRSLLLNFYYKKHLLVQDEKKLHSVYSIHK